ncbi:DUF1156 domain-containing protein [Synechococcus sp. CCY9202]|uniref:DUF1156 domain-containing protein n=1 Tax=Synechococcus sp. CCY9202 TaxID=174698 RepID=UPI002B21B40E|nr:DUF1156 domain-containing protein [Synechococcus sp. CCY9202]MEA5424747.1 DUF1156 domain-containing protein [Synechococcus sp. CCY9202]
MTSDHPVKRRKKLIEVLLPLDAINNEAIHRKSKSPKGFPSAVHKWWSPKPLASSRGVLFAQMVDDPSEIPEEFPDLESQDKERQRLLRLISELVKWDNTRNENIRKEALGEILKTWRRACQDNLDKGIRPSLFNPETPPSVWDPFAGSGSIPVSAQWLGIPAVASDLNPVSAIINKAIIEYPYQFKGKAAHSLSSANTQGAAFIQDNCEGLIQDIEYYGEIILERAKQKLSDLYPSYRIDQELVDSRPDLAHLKGQTLTCTAWIWARTVESPSPAFKNCFTPLATSYLLSSKPGKEAYCLPTYKDGILGFDVYHGKPSDLTAIKKGSSAGKRSAFICQASGDPVNYQYIRDQGQLGRIGSVLMAVVAQSKNGRVYLPPRGIDAEAAKDAKPSWKPDLDIPENPRDFKTPLYGMKKFGDLFTDRQLTAYSVFADEVRRIFAEASSELEAEESHEGVIQQKKQCLARYREAIGVYLGISVDRMIYYGTNLSGWLPKDSALRDCMPRQALAMTWEYAEANPFGKSSGDFRSCLKIVKDFLEAATPNSPGHAYAAPAQSFTPEPASHKQVISTDPPYYDNICYSELADFFYVWQKRMFAGSLPGLFETIASPKGEELLASSYRYGSREKADKAFLDGMTGALVNIASRTHPAYPITLYYAFKQTESVEDGGHASTGWESFLEAIVSAGLSITATWPLRTEKEGRLLASGTNALASCVVLVCRSKDSSAQSLTRKEFRRLLRRCLAESLKKLESANIAPVDIAQAVIGPGMAVFSSASAVLDQGDRPMSVRDALVEINAALDEYLTQDEGELDADSRFALTFFESYGYSERSFGDAEGLARARNVSVEGVARSGILKAVAGKVQLLRRNQLDDDWDPMQDDRLCIWEATQHLIKRLDSGESSAAALLARLKEISGHGNLPANCRALAYRLYNHCEKTKQPEEARAYNGLVIAWPELEKLSALAANPVQSSLL